MKTLATIQEELRGFVAQGNDLALAVLKKRLKPDTEKYQALLALEASYHEVSRQLIQDIITPEAASEVFNKCRESLLEFINNLQAADMPELAVTTSDGSGMADVYNGEVLYRIPKKMAVGVEEECIVRMAFNRQKLLHDFQVQVGDVMKDLRISDVMGVELIDPNGDKAFTITTLNDTVQFLEKDLVNEWIFCVTPIREGVYPLVLRISIIEIINGIERKRNEVLRERVEILLTLNPGEVLNEFQKGYTWQVTDTDEQRAAASGGAKGLDTTKSPMPPIPGMVSPSPMPTAPMPSAPNVSRAVGLGLIGKVIAGAAVLVIGAIAIRPFLSPNTADDPTFVDAQSNRLKGLRANPSRQELEAFVRDNPDTAAVEMAMMVLDSLENETWQAALASNDYDRMKNYLDEYPAGNYANEAAYYMDAWNRGDEVAVLDSLIENPEVIKEEPATSPQPDKPKVTKPTKTKPTKKPVTKPNTTDPKTKPPITKPPTTKPQPEPEKPAPVDPNKPVPFVSAAQKPVFKNCGNSNKEREEKCTADKIRQFLKSRFEYPREALEKSIQGTVVVSFVVERDGSITDVKALNDIGGGCAKEAVNWVKKLPKFSPGKNGKGAPIRVQYTQPVRFTLK